MRHESRSKSYEIPLDRVDALLDDLEKAVSSEFIRTGAFGGIDVKKEDGKENLRSFRENGYVGVESLKGKEVLVWSEGIYFKDGEEVVGSSTRVDFMCLRFNGKVATARMKKKKGLSYDPAVVEEVLAQYAG
jgi:hypothetical protein